MLHLHQEGHGYENAMSLALQDSVHLQFAVARSDFITCAFSAGSCPHRLGACSPIPWGGHGRRGKVLSMRFASIWIKQSSAKDHAFSLDDFRQVPKVGDDGIIQVRQAGKSWTSGFVGWRILTDQWLLHFWNQFD